MQVGIRGGAMVILGFFVAGCGKSNEAGEPAKSTLVVQEMESPVPAEAVPPPAPPPTRAATIPASASEKEPVAKEKEPLVQEKEPAKEAEKPVSPMPEIAAFQFPDTEEGKILARILAPAAPPKLDVPRAQKPIARAMPAGLIDPAGAAPRTDVPEPARFPSPVASTARPSALPDRVPLGLARSMPELPVEMKMREGELSKSPARDLSRPVDLPILARRSPDRASLEDPTADFSAASVIVAPLPLRETTAAFVKINLPDPFENAETVKTRTPLPEDPQKAIGNPAPPRVLLK